MSSPIVTLTLPAANALTGVTTQTLNAKARLMATRMILEETILSAVFAFTAPP